MRKDIYYFSFVIYLVIRLQYRSFMGKKPFKNMKIVTIPPSKIAGGDGIAEINQ